MKCAMVSLVGDQGRARSAALRKEKFGNAVLVSDIIKKAKGTDLVLFSGWTLRDKAELEEVVRRTAGTTQTVILEVGFGLKAKDASEGYYVISPKKDGPTALKQEFATSDDVNGERDRINSYLDKLEKERCFNISGRKMRLIICGENSVLRNIQSQGNAVACRIDDEGSRRRLDAILRDTDVFLNPSHTPPGNLHKMQKRWEFLSTDGRAALFVTNENPGKGKNLAKRSLSYAFKDGAQQETAHELDEAGNYRITFVEI
jgi:hypothetical protein